MNKIRTNFAAVILSITTAAASSAQTRNVKAMNFASDSQTFAVMGNTPGAQGAHFQTYVAILNPTSSSYSLEATLYDGTGVPQKKTIALGAGEQKTYQNFLQEVFGVTGGGAVTFTAPESAGGTHNNRFIINAEIWTTGTRYGTTIPPFDFAGTGSPSFAAGITVGAASRTNVGCFNQTASPNSIKATVFDKTGATVGTVDFNLAANGWGQAPINSTVTDGYVRFEPQDSAVCYAVVVNNGTNDGHFIPASEYAP